MLTCTAATTSELTVHALHPQGRSSERGCTHRYIQSSQLKHTNSFRRRSASGNIDTAPGYPRSAMFVFLKTLQYHAYSRSRTVLPYVKERIVVARNTLGDVGYHTPRSDVRIFHTTKSGGAENSGVGTVSSVVFRKRLV